MGKLGIKKAAALTLAIVLAAGSFAGCAGDNGPAASKAVSQAAGSKTTGAFAGTPGTDSLVLNLGGEPAELFSVLNTESYSGTILGYTMEGLIVRNQKGELVGGGAESWTFDEKTLTYTFKLRKDAKWADGTPVTAKDYQFAFRALVDPKFAASYAYFGYVVKNGEAVNKGAKPPEELGAKAADDYTFVIELEKPCAYFLSTLNFFSFLPVKEEAFRKHGDQYATDPDKILTNGPYKIVKWEHENQLVLEKSDSYYAKDAIGPKTITWKMISDKNTSLNDFQAGNLDFVNDITAEQSAQLKDLGGRVGVYNSNGNKFVVFNQTKKGFDNVKIRKAFTLAIDRASLTQNLLKDGSEPAFGIVPKSISNGKYTAVAGSGFFKDDTAGAKKLLEEGMKEAGITLEQLSKYSMVCDDDDTSKRVAAFLQEQWKKNLGVEVALKVVPRKSRVAALRSRDFEIILSGWFPDYDDPNTYLDMWVTKGGNNYADWSNKTYDELIQKAATELDEQKRFGLFRDAEKILMDEAAIAPLYFIYRGYVVSDKVSGEMISSWQTTFKWAKILQK